MMAGDSVGTEANELDVALCKLALKLSKGTELGGTDRGLVLRVREKNGPAVANPFVEGGPVASTSKQEGSTAQLATFRRDSLGLQGVNQLTW